MVKTYLILVFVMVTWGFNVIAIKVLVSGVSPILITSLRLFVASLAIMLILKSMKRQKTHDQIPWKYVILACLFSVVIHHLSLSIGIQRTTAVNSAIIIGLGPLIAALFSIIFQISPITKLKFCGFLLGTVGVVMAVLNKGSLASIQSGDVWVFVAILAQIIGIFIINKITSQMDPLHLTAIILTIGSVILFCISMIFEKGAIYQLTQINMHLFWVFIYSSLIPTALGQSIYNVTINKVGPAETAIFINVNTIFALIGAAIFMKETIMPLQIIGCILIIIGVIVGTSGLDLTRIRKWIKDRKGKRKVQKITIADNYEKEMIENKYRKL